MVVSGHVRHLIVCGLFFLPSAGCGASTAADGGADASSDEAADVASDAGDSATDGCLPNGATCTNPFLCCTQSCSAQSLDDGGQITLCAP